MTYFPSLLCVELLTLELLKIKWRFSEHFIVSAPALTIITGLDMLNTTVTGQLDQSLLIILTEGLIQLPT